MDTAESRHVRAWYALTGALAVHVVDEATTGFLAFYNPLVLRIRERVPWFPMPTFEFRPWLIGLVVLVVVLALLGPVVGRRMPGTTVASWILGIIMLLNGLGHLVGSAYFRQWLPGATSAPLLLVTSVMLMRATLRRREVPR